MGPGPPREGKSLTRDRFDRAWRAFIFDSKRRYLLLEVTNETLNLAQRMARQQPLRAYDAIQLATAWQANRRIVERGDPPLMFISADRRLLQMTQAFGLLINNPTDHEPA